jgi:SAM-dependent methyltransferase
MIVAVGSAAFRHSSDIHVVPHAEFPEFRKHTRHVDPGMKRTIAQGSSSGIDRFILRDFPFTDFPPRSRILDVGLGKGEQTAALIARGCRAVGIDIDHEKACRARASGLPVVIARAEHLPFRTGAFDGVIVKVVLPYTDEAVALNEISRILRVGAIGRLCYQGVGYSLRMFTELRWKRHVYAVRVIANTIVYALTGRRLPGFVGHTIYQSRSRLRRHYQNVGLRLIEERRAPRFLNSPVFIYHTVSRSADWPHR